jgi:hypothetical protein
MSKVLSISDRLDEKRRREQLERHHSKVEAVKRAVQCSSCHLKCAMCGVHFDADDSSCCPPFSSSQDFNLCETCHSEFDDYREIVDGQIGADIFWHNKKWLKLWSAWVAYQEAIVAFRNSREFRQLINEPDE